MFDFSKLNKVHFIGIGGISMSAIALLLKKKDKEVSGSDMAASEITDNLQKEGIKFFLGHRAENIAADVDLVIYTSSVPEDNVERQEAVKNKIPQMTNFEFLGDLSEKYYTITVCGTKGKTTTTILSGLLLNALDPTVVVGGKVKEYNGSNLRIGKSPYLVAEACEWQANFLHLNPAIAVLTNLEPEHLDYYRDFNHIIETFQEYVSKLPPEGYLIINADDPNQYKVAEKSKGKLITYGIKYPADVMAKEIKTGEGQQTFELWVDGRMITDVVLQVPGLYNIYNVLAATALAVQLGIKFNQIKETVEKFNGSWRRFEKVKEENGVIFISDYAHTPASVDAVITAAREFYPTRRIVTVFQPHLHSRTKKFFNEFANAFGKSDLTIISDIYFVAGRVKEEDKDVSSKDLAEAIKKYSSAPVFYGEDLSATKKILAEQVKENDLVLVIGAGDIYKIL